jgi:hypothetical protein
VHHSLELGRAKGYAGVQYVVPDPLDLALGCRDVPDLKYVRTAPIQPLHRRRFTLVVGHSHELADRLSDEMVMA